VHAVERPAIPQVLAGGQFFVEARRLENHADLRANERGLPDHITATNACGSAIGSNESGEDPEESRLAAPVRAEEGKQLAGVDLKIQSGKNREAPVFFDQPLC